MGTMHALLQKQIKCPVAKLFSITLMDLVIRLICLKFLILFIEVTLHGIAKRCYKEISLTYPAHDVTFNPTLKEKKAGRPSGGMIMSLKKGSLLSPRIIYQNEFSFFVQLINYFDESK